MEANICDKYLQLEFCGLFWSQFILRIIKQLSNFSSSSLICGLSPVLTSDISLLTVFILLQRLNWFNLRVMKLISWWLLTVCYRPAGLWPRQSDCGGVLHRQMSSGWYEEHLREYTKHQHQLWKWFNIFTKSFSCFQTQYSAKNKDVKFLFLLSLCRNLWTRWPSKTRWRATTCTPAPSVARRSAQRKGQKRLQFSL